MITVQEYYVEFRLIKKSNIMNKQNFIVILLALTSVFTFAQEKKIKDVSGKKD